MIENFTESTKYAQSLFNIKDAILQAIESESLDEGVPIISREVLKFMIFTAKGIKARDILEIGTAVGYSGIFLSRVANENGGSLTTIEIDEERYSKAVKNFQKIGILSRNNLILGDALEEIPKLEGKEFDFIFIDASKGQYMKFFDLSWKLLRKNGIIFIDNIMFRGLVAEDSNRNSIEKNSTKPRIDEIPKRYRTIVKRLKEFIYRLEMEFDFVLLPFGDGVGLVRK